QGDDDQYLQFRIQTATSDYQNNQDLLSSLFNDLDDLRKHLADDLGDRSGSPPAVVHSRFDGTIEFQNPPDAMHGTPKNSQELQTMIQDLKNLINSLDVDDKTKLELTAQVQELDQLAQQSAGDQGVTSQELQLLSDLRNALAPYVS